MTQTGFRLRTVVAMAAVAISIIAALLVGWSGSPASGVSQKVIVSLTWDDGRANQATTTAIQDAHGMKATYYINSGDIDSSGYYLTKAQLDQISADGNEIGGHTQHHERLTSISLDAATSTICNDRQTLVDWYGPAAGRSFAYPYGASNSDVQKIPATCGYTSARGVTGIRTAKTCLGCPYAEALPPRNPWNLAVPPSISSATTLEDLKFQVTQAASGGGGWIIYTMHSIGNPADAYNIDPSVYDTFLSWLAARSDVQVMTVGDVMGTTWTVPTTTTTTTVPQTPPTAVAMVNAGLELDADKNGLSDCWLRGYAGTNTATWKRTTSAHTGGFAEEVTISSFTNGDRKIVPMLDSGTANGGCSPSVSGSNSYSLNVWYRSTGVSNMVVFLRDSSGAWRYWRTGPIVSPSSTWATTSMTTGALPVGTTAISYGLALEAVGTLATDDYSMTQDSVAAPPQSDPYIKNSSFEADSNNDGIADCWLKGGFGTSTYSFSRVSSSHSGVWAQKISVSSFSTGDRKIVQPLDSGQAAGGCALDISGGISYRLGTWYQSDTTPSFYIYLRDSSGNWRWWISTYAFPTSLYWSEASYITPPLPAGTTALSFGLGVNTVGSLTVDDASLVPL